MKNHDIHEMTREKRRKFGSLVAFLKRCHSERSEESQKRRRWVSAPQSSWPGAPAVQGVALALNEDEQWTWTHAANGSYVSGYTIVPRLIPRPAILRNAKNIRYSQQSPRRKGK